MGTIPSGQLNYSTFEYLNISGKELYINNFTEQILFKKKKKTICSHILTGLPPIQDVESEESCLKFF